MNSRFGKGALVWYLQRDGSHREAKVVSVDITVEPPSYAVDLGESVRETEAHRLQLRQPGEAPPSVPAQRPLAGPAATPQQAALDLDLEDDDFGDFADSAEAAQPGVSHLHGFMPPANGFTPSVNGFSQHQPLSNGFSHAPVAMNGLSDHAAPVHSGKSAHESVAANQEKGEEDFAAFTDTEEPVSGPSNAAAWGVGQAISAHPAQTGQPWPEFASFSAGPAAVQSPALPPLESLYASSQHVRGPSVESAASVASANGPAFSAFDAGFPSGLLNGAKGEREYRVTPASTLSIAQQELGSDSDDDFGDFEDAQPDVAQKASTKPLSLDRNAPIPLSLFGEEEDNSAPSEPVLDLAAPWGGFLLPGQPWASAVAEQEKAAASQSAATHAAQAPDRAAVPIPDAAVTVQQPGQAPHLGPASSLAAESSDSWATAFTEASQALPGSNGMPDGAAASHSAPDGAQSNAAELPSSNGPQPSLQLQMAETQEHVDSTSCKLQATPTDEPEHVTQHVHPGRPTPEVVDAEVSLYHGSAPAGDGVDSAQAGPVGQSQIRTPPGSIDWSAMDFDFGAAGSPVNAAEPVSQHFSPGESPLGGIGSSAAAEAEATNPEGAPEEAPSSSSAMPGQATAPASAAHRADEDDDWDFGDFSEAAASVPEVSLESAAVDSLPALDLQSFQAPSAAGSQSVVEPPNAPSEAFLDWDEGSLAISNNTAASANQDDSGGGRTAAVVTIESTVADGGWESWDASEAAAASPAPVTAELGGAPSLAAALPSPRLSAQLAPGGSGVLSFDQWGRAYSKLEQQAAKSGTGKQPAADPEAAGTQAANADTFSLPEPSSGASQAPAADVWASLAALDEGHALGTPIELTSSEQPAQSAYTAGSMPSHDAFTDPFAAFDSVAEESGSTAGPTAISTEGEQLSLPMSAVGSIAASLSAEDGFVRGRLPEQVEQPAEVDVKHTSTAGSADSRQQALQAGKKGMGEQPSFTAQRSWGDGWADCVADSKVPLPAQTAQAPDTVSSWKRQEDDMALEKALGCDRQTALLCLAQAAAGILVNGQQLWTEACSLGSSGIALGCSEVQQYLAALAHVRFVACAVDAALCCGAAAAPSVEAELCRALAQCEEAWQQSTSGVASLAEALEELVRGDSNIAASARKAQDASQALSQLQTLGQLDPAVGRCPLTGLPHPLCPDISLAELHGRPAWAPVANLYCQHCPLQASRKLHC